MTSVWRRIQKSNKKSVKYRFTITPQELLIICSTKWHPQTVVVTCMHRRRKVEGRVRRWESSMIDPCRGLIVWPSQTPDPLLFDTTLYCDDSIHHYSDKEWTLLVEECTRKGKRKAIAAVNLNMPLFVQDPETVIELKLKLRPLWPELSHCSMQILISSVLIGDEETNELMEAELADIAFQTKEGSNLNLEKEPKALPAVVESEDLLTWCQRVTSDYPSVRITDFAKSFRSGLAFCAIIHRYRPDLLGPFSKLNFTDSHSNRLENCRKALDAATLIGVEKKLDPGITVTLPDRNDIRCFLSELRMLLVDVPAIKRESSVNESDCRISSLFNLSESEANVMRELEILRRQRERDEAVDLTNITDEDRTKFSAVVPASQKVKDIRNMETEKRSEKLNDPFDSDSDSDGANNRATYIPLAHQSSINRNADVNVNINTAPISSVVTTRHVELMKKRQQISSVPSVITDSTDAVARERRHREEARRLMNDAASDGATLVIGGSAPTTAHQSPADETPVSSPHERSTGRLSSSITDIQKSSLGVTLDRAKRYGSMRGQELIESVAKVAGRAFTPSLSTSDNPVNATPTRKLISQWEKDGADLEKIQAELNCLSKRLAQVSGEDEIICSQLMKAKVSSEEEERLLQEHMRLLTEKDAIVRRTEYFNVLEQLREVEDEITKLQRKLGSASVIDQIDKTEDDKQKIDKMMDDLVALVNKKDRLSQKLISHEAEDEEIDERDRLTLEAAANFSRGTEQPLSASKRIITWIRSEISS
ncbi:conserved hypothetical protein,hypothetical protein [Brugia malayi]|uniref:BMA-EHBP-1, isoform d n=1 Tax=Brugia malayi TaxID=6279 RepID=A0A0K0JAS7_BRUMA|nr:conserved hypothetical protein,hypothetical protein [Brugia malayi]CDP98934.1 BMA-EHBP-1, isoform d [Brugia malayi]VIO98127.1 conserved hypothetical protein,hypothetical protein [Brugia malayi]